MKAIIKRILKDINHYKWGVLLFLVYYVTVKAIFHAYCPLVIVTGFPCPACGLTRGVMFLLTGQWVRAYYMNPLIFVYALFALWIGINRYILDRKIKHIKLWIILLLLSLIGVYVYRMTTIFPGYPPVSYTRNNLLEKYSPFYDYWLHRLLEIW